MRSYFKLFSTTLYLHSDKEGCLYNTLNGNVISLVSEQNDAVFRAENGESVQCMNVDLLAFFDLLERESLGAYVENPIIIEPSFWGENPFYNKVTNQRRYFETLQIELTNKCNLDCIFCETNSEKVYRKTSCKSWENNNTNSDFDTSKWTKYINESYLLGCKKIQIFGGEPLLKWNEVKNIIEASKKIGINEIEIYTNGTILTDSILGFFSENNIKIILQISNFTNNKSILGLKEDVDYYEILSKLSKYEIKFEILLVVSRYNDSYLNNYIAELKSKKYDYRLDLINPFPENNHYSEVYKDSILNYKKKLIKVNPMNIGVLMMKNPCYSGMLAISSDGVVYPCIKSRHVSYGIIDGTNRLVSVLNEEYEELSNLSKSNMNTCVNCVYRYACVSCTAVEMSATKGTNNCKNCSLLIEQE